MTLFASFGVIQVAFEYQTASNIPIQLTLFLRNYHLTSVYLSLLNESSTSSERALIFTSKLAELFGNGNQPKWSNLESLVFGRIPPESLRST